MIVCLLICYGNLLVKVLSSQCCQHKTNKRDSVIRKTGTAEENSSETVFGFIHRTKMYSMILTFLVVLVCKVCRCYCMSCHSENSDATCSWSETKKFKQNTWWNKAVALAESSPYTIISNTMTAYKHSMRVARRSHLQAIRRHHHTSLSKGLSADRPWGSVPGHLLH